MDVQLPELLRHIPPSSALPDSSPWPAIYSAARIERALLGSFAPITEEAPPLLAAAIRHAVFPGGGRLRPKLCLAVASACGDPEPSLTDAAAVAIELIHSASLVHDDLPCFDGAETRRGQPSVHRAFGESIAVLAGDQLIVLAFEHVAQASVVGCRKLAKMVSLLARGVGAPHGIIAGQAWESEEGIDPTLYRRKKTGALFEAAAALGALSAGASPACWGRVGAKIGEAYQLADDINDVMGDPSRMGKPTGQDAALGRPNVVHEMGLDQARKLFDCLVQSAFDAVPHCAHPEIVRVWLRESVRQITR